MQIVQGTCGVTNNNAKVIASTADVDWSDALLALQQGSPLYFALVTSDPSSGDSVPRQVVAVQSSTTSSSGFWELTLVSPWTGATQTLVNYMIHKDFTPNYGLALATIGEQNWAQLFSRNMQTIDANMPGSGVGITSGTTLVGNGKTMYAADDLEIPLNFDLEIALGGRVEIG